MKATGIVRRLDELGRITLPIELRRVLNIGEKDPVEIFSEENRIVLQKYEGDKPVCSHCGSDKELRQLGTSHICRKCADTVKMNWR